MVSIHHFPIGNRQLGHMDVIPIIFQSDLKIFDNKTMEVKLAEVLEREFKSQNLSIREVAKNCRIPKATLTDWVNGVKPSARTLHYLYDLADYLRLSLDSLLFNIIDDESKSEIIMSTLFRDQEKSYRITIERLVDNDGRGLK